MPSLLHRSLRLATIAALLFVASSARAQAPAPPLTLEAPAPLLAEAARTLTPAAGVVTLSPASRARRVHLLQRALVGVALRYSEYPLGSANALIAVGSIAIALQVCGSATLYALYSLSNASWRAENDLDYLALATGVGVLVGLAFVLIGVFTRQARVTRRAPYERRIREIRAELDGYARPTALGVRPVPSSAAVRRP